VKPLAPPRPLVPPLVGALFLASAASRCSLALSSSACRSSSANRAASFAESAAASAAARWSSSSCNALRSCCQSSDRQLFARKRTSSAPVHLGFRSRSCVCSCCPSIAVYMSSSLDVSFTLAAKRYNQQSPHQSPSQRRVPDATHLVMPFCCFQRAQKPIKHLVHLPQLVQALAEFIVPRS